MNEICKLSGTLFVLPNILNIFTRWQHNIYVYW